MASSKSLGARKSRKKSGDGTESLEERGDKKFRADEIEVARRRRRSLAIIKAWGRRIRGLEKVREGIRQGVGRFGEKLGSARVYEN